ncbi:MAG TPA: HEPN domain-containing protein [Longimicrobiaceae bacterium]|nr:HEPN domain-containing protein [Longimicrobiaceae bacterium]
MPLNDAVRAWIARWLRLAEGDLAMAKLGLASDGFDVFELVGFHAQQAAEKLIKAFLVHRSVEFGDVHDIDTLLKLVRTANADLATKLDPAAALTPYAVGTRYPGRYGTVTRDQAETAVQIAEAVRREILPFIAGEGEQPGDSLKERLRRQKENRQ